MAMQQVFSQCAFDFVFIKLAGACIGIAAVDLIDTEAMLCQQIVVGVEQTDVGERRRVVFVPKAMHFSDAVHGGHDGGAQLGHDGEIEVPDVERVAGDEAGAVGEFEMHFAKVSARCGGVGHEDIDPVGLIDDDAVEFLRRHVEWHKRVGIIPRWQWCHRSGLGNTHVMLTQHLRRGQQRIGITLGDAGGTDFEVFELLRRAGDDDLQRFPLATCGVQRVCLRGWWWAAASDARHAIAEGDLHRLGDGLCGQCDEQKQRVHFRTSVSCV